VKRTIARMEVFGVQMPMVGTYTSAGVTKQVIKCVVIRLVASDGAVGISSIEPSAAAKSPGTAVELEATLRERIAPAVVGLDPLNIHRLLEVCDSIAPTQPGAVAGAEMACVELAARIHGVPVHAWLGGAVTDRLRFNAWIGALPAEEAATEAKRWLQAGFQSAKIKVGGGVEADAERVQAVRAAVGSAMQLRIDANALYDAETSLRLARLVRQCDLQFFEQPAPKADIAGLARVRKEGGIPVMADESVSDHASLVAIIKAGAADYVKFGVKQAGGFVRAQRMLATAEAAGIPCVIGHGFGLDPSTIAEVMFSATSRNVVPGLECVGPLKMKDTVTTTRLDISSGSLALPGGPGVGVILDEAKLQQYRLG
jgi:L-alanine-DL-glutamate epimerase-like enolase superfamily enzyme